MAAFMDSPTNHTRAMVMLISVLVTNTGTMSTRLDCVVVEDEYAHRWPPYSPLDEFEIPGFKALPPRPWVQSSYLRPAQRLGRWPGVRSSAGVCRSRTPRTSSLRDRRNNKRKFFQQKIWREAGLSGRRCQFS